MLRKHSQLASLWVFTLLLILFVSLAYSEEWPQWRGPSGDGVSKETGLPSRWNTTDNVAWKLAMPDLSGSTPIIWGNHVFLNVADSGELHLWVLDRRDGSVRWKQFLSGGDKRQRKQNMSSPSPVTDGKHVWVLTGTGALKGFDFNGVEIWSRDIQRDYGTFGLNWGYASSPLLHGDSIYIQVLHGMKTDDPSYIVRIEKMTGETLWKVERISDAIRESPDSYTTPALLEYDGKRELIITGGDVVTSHDLGTGEEIWRLKGLNPQNNPNYRIVASPVVLDRIIIAPTRVRPMVAIKVGGKGNISDTHRLWSFDNGPDVPTPVSDGKYLYIVNDRGIMFCLNQQTGAIIWGPERIASGTYSSSPVLADGKLYVTNEDSLTTVIKAGAIFQTLSENQLDGYTLSSLAISRGQLFMRTDEFLYVIGEESE